MWSLAEFGPLYPVEPRTSGSADSQLKVTPLPGHSGLSQPSCWFPQSQKGEHLLADGSHSCMSCHHIRDMPSHCLILLFEGSHRFCLCSQGQDYPRVWAMRGGAQECPLSLSYPDYHLCFRHWNFRKPHSLPL